MNPLVRLVFFGGAPIVTGGNILTDDGGVWLTDDSGNVLTDG